MNSQRKIFVIVGEASADLHTSKLISEMKSIDPYISFYGIGGPKMEAEGATIHFQASELGVVGLSELRERWGAIQNALHFATSTIRETRPDAILMVDYPDFNFRVAKKIADLKIPIIYYISPQVWAWRSGRIQVLKKFVKKMMVIFPFEKNLYDQAHVPVDFVGHPLVDEIDQECQHIKPSELMATLGLDRQKPVITLMPGSRRSEIHHHLETILEATKIIHRQRPDCQFVLPVAPTLSEVALENYVRKSHAPVTLTRWNATQVLSLCRFAIIASGTSTLQAALLGKPMAIVYRVGGLGWFLYKNLFRKIPFIGLPNIISEKEVVPELVQNKFKPELIAQTVMEFLTHEEKYDKTVKELEKIRALLKTESKASTLAAQCLYSALEDASQGDRP